MTFETAFSLRDRVCIDGDRSLMGVVTAVQFREIRAPLYGVSYVFNGDAREAWFEEWRLACL
jgi:hypothetical protein